MLREAVWRGITHIDTSAFYGPDVANELVQEALHPYSAELLVATKVGVMRDVSRAFVPAARPDQLREQIQRNLEQLQLEQLNLVYLRVGGDGLLPPDPTPFAESFGALVDLQQGGVVRYLGLSGVTSEQLAQALELAPVVAGPEPLPPPRALQRPGASRLRAARDRVCSLFPLAAGMLNPDLDTSQLPPGMGPSQAQHHALDRIAARYDATRWQIALAWLLQHSAATLAIPGTSSVAQLHQNIAATELRLAPEDVTALDSFPGLSAKPRLPTAPPRTPRRTTDTGKPCLPRGGTNPAEILEVLSLRGRQGPADGEVSTEVRNSSCQLVRVSRDGDSRLPGGCGSVASDGDDRARVESSSSRPRRDRAPATR